MDIASQRPAIATHQVLLQTPSVPNPFRTKLRRSLSKLIIYGTDSPLDILVHSNTLDVVFQDGKDCAQYMGGPLDAGPHMTTATVPRDLDSILDAYPASSDVKSLAGCNHVELLGFDL